MGAPPRRTPFPQVTDAIRSTYRRSMWALVLRGLLSLAIGVLIFAHPFASVAALALVIAIWALLDGIANIARAFTLRKVVEHWWAFLVAGIIGVVFGGAALYYYPTLSLSFAVVWTSFWLLSAGVMGIYLAVKERRMDVSWGWTMFLGVLLLAGGVLALMHPGTTLVWLMSFIASIAIVVGIMELVAAYRLHSVAKDIKTALGDR